MAAPILIKNEEIDHLVGGIKKAKEDSGGAPGQVSFDDALALSILTELKALRQTTPGCGTMVEFGMEVGKEIFLRTLHDLAESEVVVGLDGRTCLIVAQESVQEAFQQNEFKKTPATKGGTA